VPSEIYGKIVAFTSVGNMGGMIIRDIAQVTSDFLGLSIDVLPGLNMPADAFSPGRRQYHAGKLLQLLAGSYPEYHKVIGITLQDLFLPIFTHVYGEAQMPGRAAIVSLYRIGSADGAHHIDHIVLMQRSLKVVVHEFLHTFEFVHCRHLDCLMRPVTKIEDLDQVPMKLCRSCGNLWNEQEKTF
jgi:archaemetzincin